jgi:hypothetical protein
MISVPYFPFYPSDWLSDEKIQSMSMEGEGVYIHLLAIEWREGSIPADRSAIVMLCKGRDSSAIEEALTCFRPHPRKIGRLFNKRLEEERKKLSNFRKSKKIAGLKGANKRWHSHDLPLAKNASSSSSSPSSSEEKKEEKRIGQTASPFDPLFSEFWSAYPKKVHREASRLLFIGICKKGLEKELASGFNGYVDFLKHKRVHDNFPQEPMNPETFLRKDRWREHIGFAYKPKL